MMSLSTPVTIKALTNFLVQEEKRRGVLFKGFITYNVLLVIVNFVLAGGSERKI